MSSTYLNEFREQIAKARREAAQPLVDRLAELNESIAKKDAEVKAERDERSEIMSELRKIDPALAPPLREGPTKKKEEQENRSNGKPASPPSPQMLEKLEGWLREHPEVNAMNDGLGFRPTDLYTRDDFDIIKSESAVNKSLNMLRDEGALRLVRWERGRPQPGKPTGKFYKFIA